MEPRRLNGKEEPEDDRRASGGNDVELGGCSSGNSNGAANVLLRIGMKSGRCYRRWFRCRSEMKMYVRVESFLCFLFFGFCFVF